MTKNRSRQQQAVALSRVAAAVKLQAHRPKVQESAKHYKRAKEKRRWQHDQDGAFVMPFAG